MAGHICAPVFSKQLMSPGQKSTVSKENILGLKSEGSR
jgi:hypothetical protein